MELGEGLNNENQVASQLIFYSLHLDSVSSNKKSRAFARLFS